ncbi:MAG: hypothetical protein WCG25_08915, partial [bacterium]
FNSYSFSPYFILSPALNHSSLAHAFICDASILSVVGRFSLKVMSQFSFTNISHFFPFFSPSKVRDFDLVFEI